MNPKNEKATILEMNFTAPIIISGVYITEEALKHLSFLQTGTPFFEDADWRKFNNDGANSLINDCNEIIHNLFELLLQADNDERPRIVEVMEAVYLMLSRYNDLKLPDDLLVA